MTNKLTWIVPLSAMAVVLLGFAALTYANPFYTGTKAQSAVATTTIVFMTPGAATSTTVYDSYEQYGTNQTNAGNLTLPNSVAVILDGRASSTATTVAVACEYSDNYNGSTGNGDWYQNEIYAPTTTGALPIGTALSFSFTYSSSTSQVGGVGGTASSNRFQKLVECPVPTRFVRAVVSVSGANVSVWTQIIPKKQRN